ncbi:MAG TPA: hypothetical protein VD963_10755 [Phycisphaerales bacterium]|nr:hypothetical protein [Phycisphaerales bacterium]
MPDPAPDSPPASPPGSETTAAPQPGPIAGEPDPGQPKVTATGEVATGNLGRWGKATRSIQEGKFLEGPHSRSFELGRTLRICWEFLR